MLLEGLVVGFRCSDMLGHPLVVFFAVSPIELTERTGKMILFGIKILNQTNDSSLLYFTLLFKPLLFIILIPFH